MGTGNEMAVMVSLTLGPANGGGLDRLWRPPTRGDDTGSIQLHRAF